MQGQTFFNRYRIEKTLGESSASTVYKALDVMENNRPVAVKILKSENISHRLVDIIRFQAESDTVSRLSHPHISKVYGRGEYNDLHYIVMEYVDGASLRDFMRSGLKDDLNLFVDILIGICEALDYVHRKSIIHRDIKPGNVLIALDEDTGALKELKLIDFGLSRIKKPEIGDVSEMTGTLQYIAPEQTGLLRKHVDERSDLYSLGVLFYELLAQKPPFIGPRLSSLIHQHIAKRPEPLSSVKKNVPQILDKIVLKLLEKEQDDRYQSARGLLSDLTKYKNGSNNFILGMDDKVLKLYYRTRLTGRENELEALKSAVKAEGSIIFIKGEAGIGKSRLVEELKESISAKGMTFLKAKCFLSENKTPYGPFEELLNEYVKDFFCYTNAEKTAIREELKECMQGSGEVVLRLNPRMREVIGDSPPLVALEPDREHQRFIRIAGRFFLDLGKIENGVVIFLDDLQWMDEGSFEILNEIAGIIAEYPLFIIGAYRDNEVTADHCVSRFREAWHSKKCTFREIALEWFTQNKMNQFIAGLLFDVEDNVREISAFVFQKSQGNPFFALEILKQMAAEKAIVQENGAWKIVRGILESIAIPTSIVDILLKRISLLGEKEIAVLSYAAVIGKVFDIELLFELEKDAGTSPDKANKEIVGIVEKAKDLQLLEEDAQVKGKLLFVHDRIRDAFYRKIGERKRKKLHDAVGRALERTNTNGRDSVIFDLARHFIEAEDDEKTVQYALPAGMKAKDNYANAEAIRYLTIVKELLEKMGLGKSTKWIRCVEALCEVYLLIAKNDEVIRLNEELMPLLSDNIEKAKANMQIGRAYVKKWDYKKCEQYVKIGLELLGEKYPLKTWAVVLSIVKEFIVHAAHNRFPRALIRRKTDPKNEEKYKMIIWHYYSLSTIYVMSNIPAYVRSIFRTLNLSESKIGASRELVLALTAYTTVLTTIPLFKRAYSYNQRALDMSRRINDAWGAGKCHQHFGFFYQWKAEFGTSLHHLNESIEIFNRINDIKEIGYSLDMMKTSYIYLSDYENAVKVNNDYFEISKKCDDFYGIGDSLADSITICCETGNLVLAEKCLRESEAIDEKYKTSHANFRQYVGAGLLARAKDETRQAIECLEKARDEYESSGLMEQYTCFIYSYLVDAYIAEHDTLKDKRLRKARIGKIKRYVRLALKKTKPWLTHYGAALIVRGKYYAITKRKKKAEIYFLRGIACCERTGRKYDEAVGYYEYGIFHSTIKRENEAKASWAKSYRIFAELGAGLYLTKVKSLLRLRDEEESPIRKLIEITKNKQLSSDVLGLMRDLIASADIEKTIDGVMETVLEMTGAQRSCVIRRNPRTGDLEIIAGKNMEKEEVSFDGISLTVVFDALDGRETILTRNVDEDETISRYQSIIKYGIQEVLCFPVTYMGNVVGVCYCDTQLPSLAVTKEGMEALAVLITQFIISFESTSPAPQKRKVLINEKHIDSKCEEFGLTKREKEVLLSTVKGFNNREICAHFDITWNTLRTHLKKIHAKAGANDRDELIDIFANVKLNT